MKRMIILGVTAVVLSVTGGSALAADGAAVYKARCAMCHGAGGEGTPMAPAFAGNEFVKSSTEAELSEVTVKGRAGAAKKYKKYAMGMPAQKLTDDELKAVIGYIKGMSGK